MNMMKLQSQYLPLTTLIVLLFFSLPLYHSQTPQSIKKEMDEATKVSLQYASQAIAMFGKTLKDSEKIGYDEGILKSKDALCTIYFNNGEYEKVIKISSDVEDLALKLNDFASLAGIYRNLAASYSMLRLNDQALITLDKAKMYAGKIDDKTTRHYTTALIYDSYSVCIGEANQDPDKMIYYVKKSLEELAKISDREKQSYIEAKYDLTGFQYFRLADLYYSELKQNSTAEEYYRKALEIYENPKYNILPSNKVILYSSLSDFYYAQKDYKNSVLYAEKALSLTHKYDQPEMRKDIYNNLFKAYLETGEKEKSRQYADLYTKLNDSLKKAERKSVNTSVNKIISEKETEKNKTIKNVILLAGFLAVAMLLLGWIFWRNKNKKLHRNYEKLIEKIKLENTSETGTDKIHKASVTETSVSKNKEIQISDDTTNLLLKKLEKFEKSNKFTKQEVSFSYLSNYLETNSKYLNEILKTHKGKTFSQYINDLRIDYITGLLYKETKYRNYKITYLAEVCGFASREVFTIAFKKRTGITPSYFIENLGKEE